MNIIRNCRDITGYTTPIIAEKMGLSVSTVTKLINDKNPIIADHVTKISDLLKEYLKLEKEKAKKIKVILGRIGKK